MGTLMWSWCWLEILGLCRSVKFESPWTTAACVWSGCSREPEDEAERLQRWTDIIGLATKFFRVFL